MTMYGVEKACWSTNLLAVLDDKSLAFQSRLDLADKLDFDVLAAKLVTFHGVPPDFYRTQWNEIKIAAGESHQQCAQRTQTISYNWMKTATTRADVIDMMNREKLLDVMELSVQTWVRQQCPKTLNTAAELADIYVMSQPKREEPRKWSRYGGNQEWSKLKLSKSDYSKPSGPRMPAATISTATHTNKPLRLPAFDAIKGPCCFQGNDYGHITKLCPMKLCLMAKVHLRDLERTRGSINGQRVKDLIIDSGCQVTQVHPRWLAPDYKRETPIRIACIHGDVITHDTTIVDIEVLGKVVTTQVAVNPKLACDGLIGVDILASGEHKCSYLAQTRSKTKSRRQKKITDNTGPEFPPWKMENTGDIQPDMDVKLSRERKSDIKEAVKTYKAARGVAAARTDRATMQVETGKALPSSSPLHRLTHARRPIVQKEIKEMLREGIIQSSHSPWAAPIVLVPKKDGSLRI